MKNYGGPLVDAFTAVWTQIQRRHPDTPDVVVTMASGSSGQRRGIRLGRFGADTWKVEPGVWSELFVGAEGLAADAPGVLATVLHYAGHGIASTRAVKETSRAGAYHNAKYKQIAEELGLTVERTTRKGWAVTTLTPETADQYRNELAALTRVLVAHRKHQDPQALSADGSGPDDQTDDGASAADRAPRGGSALVCRCDPARRVRAYKKTIAAGPIVCGICQQPFLVDLAAQGD